MEKDTTTARVDDAGGANYQRSPRSKSGRRNRCWKVGSNNNRYCDGSAGPPRKERFLIEDRELFCFYLLRRKMQKRSSAGGSSTLSNSSGHVTVVSSTWGQEEIRQILKPHRLTSEGEMYWASYEYVPHVKQLHEVLRNKEQVDEEKRKEKEEKERKRLMKMKKMQDKIKLQEESQKDQETREKEAREKKKEDELKRIREIIERKVKGITKDGSIVWKSKEEQQLKAAADGSSFEQPPLINLPKAINKGRTKTQHKTMNSGHDSTTKSKSSSSSTTPISSFTYSREVTTTPPAPILNNNIVERRVKLRNLELLPIEITKSSMIHVNNNNNNKEEGISSTTSLSSSLTIPSSTSSGVSVFFTSFSNLRELRKKAEEFIEGNKKAVREEAAFFRSYCNLKTKLLVKKLENSQPKNKKASSDAHLTSIDTHRTNGNRSNRPRDRSIQEDEGGYYDDSSRPISKHTSSTTNFNTSEINNNHYYYDNVYYPPNNNLNNVLGGVINTSNSPNSTNTNSLAIAYSPQSSSTTPYESDDEDNIISTTSTDNTNSPRNNNNSNSNSTNSGQIIIGFGDEEESLFSIASGLKATPTIQCKTSPLFRFDDL